MDVHEITFDTDYLLQAGRLTEYVVEHFLDRADKMFYFTSSEQKDVPLRRKDLYDSATPSGNSTMVRNLQRIGILMGNESYRTLATDMLLTMKGAIEKYPSSFSRWGTALINEVFGIPEIAVVGEHADSIAQAINGHFIPQKTMMATTQANDNFPLLAGKDIETETMIYHCQDYACRQPVKTVEELIQSLREGLS